MCWVLGARTLMLPKLSSSPTLQTERLNNHLTHPVTDCVLRHQRRFVQSCEAYPDGLYNHRPNTIIPSWSSSRNGVANSTASEAENVKADSHLPAGK